MELFDLKEKVALVTGGNGGIGKGIAGGLAAAGSAVVIAGRDELKTAEAVAEIERDFDVNALGVYVEVQQENQIQGMIEQAIGRFGRIDILVNNAGMNIIKRPEQYEASEWDEIMDVNLRSVFLCSKAAYPAMKEAGGGKIINIGSMASIFGSALLAPYGASKGGVVQLTRSLAVAWARDNIQVNAILPGWIATELTKEAREHARFKEYVISRTPAARWGEPNDLAGAAVFLASEASNFVTGVALPVDGGLAIML